MTIALPTPCRVSSRALRCLAVLLLAMALSLHLNLPLIDLTRHGVQRELLSHIPQSMARKYHIIPLDVIDDSLAVVMEDPTDINVIEELTARTGMSILPMIGVRDSTSMAMPIRVLITAKPSVPASIHRRAFSAMSV